MQDLLKFLFLVITGRFRNAFDLMRQLKLGSQLAFVFIGLGSYALHQYPRELYSFAERGYYSAKLAAGANTDAIPLSRGGQQQLAELIKTLQNDQAVEFRRRNLGVEQGYNAWAVSQIVVSLGNEPPIEPAAVQQFFEKTLDEDCGCWRETPQKQPHTGATAWTIFAMSTLQIAAPPRVVSSLLNMQAPDGWWPLYPSKLEPKSASTYATAWATLALCTQLPLQGKGPAADTAKMKFGIENALNWLAKNEIARSARWPDYPANTPSIHSASISGLIVHVMHECGTTEGAERLHRQWLTGLPADATSASATEQTNTYVTLSSGALDFDRTRHYVLPWSLVATADAYAAGTLTQRAAALQWFERTLTPALASPEVRNQNWVSAEVLYALKYLRTRVAPGAPSQAKM